MATGKKNGDLFLLYADGSPFAEALDTTLSISENQIDVTTKDSSRWVSRIGGDRDCTITFSGLVDFGASFGAEMLFEKIANNQTITWLFRGESGDEEWTGTGRVSAEEINAAHNAAVGYSGTISGSGAPTKSTTA